MSSNVRLDADAMAMIARTHAVEKVELRMRIAALEGMWSEIDIALCNAEVAMREHNCEPARVFYAKLRDRLRTAFVDNRLST